jgi:hypothetical protein
MDYNELRNSNLRLWEDGICRGGISYSAAGGLSPGGPITNIFTEGFLGGPHPPIIFSFDPTGNIPIGPSDTYPKPWRGAQQRLNDASYGSTIGPFARLVSIPNTIFVDDTCQEGQEDDQCKIGLFGRLGLGDGNAVGFRLMDWHGQDEGNFDTAYFNNQYSSNWDTWKEWWENASKATVFAKWEDVIGNPTVEVEVAYDYIGTGDDDFYPGLDGKVYLDNSLDLLVAMVAIAVLIRW